MRVAIIGGGSTYSPELFDGLVRLRTRIPVDSVVLIDPDEARRTVVAGMCRRMLAHAGHPAVVTDTADPAAGVTDADVVLIQLRIGGQDARQLDETVPHSCGCIGQETTGAGGLAKALRTVPAVLQLADIVCRRARPGAWILDFTNPVGIVTRALLGAGHRAVGLCNVAIGFQRSFADRLGARPAAVDLDHVGLNHLTWEVGVRVDGVERLPDLLADHGTTIARQVGLPVELLALQRAVPSYYLHYFYAHDAELAAQVAPGAITRAQAVRTIEAELLAQYADPATVTKPDALSRRGGAHYSDAAIDLMAALHGDHEAGDRGAGDRGAGDRAPQVVNLRNDGRLPFLPDDHVVEVTADVSPAGARALPATAALPPGAAGLIAHVAEYERLALDAAVRGDPRLVAAALLAHPLIGQYDVAEKLTGELLHANREFLPWVR